MASARRLLSITQYILVAQSEQCCNSKIRLLLQVYPRNGSTKSFMQIYPLKALSWPVLTFYLNSTRNQLDFTFCLVSIKRTKLGLPSKNWPLEESPFCRLRRHSGLHATQ